MLINGFDGDNKIEGTFVDVCEHGGLCQPCGVVLSAPAPGKWGAVYCLAGGIIGNELRLRHGYNQLVLCAIQVFGDEMGMNSPV